MTTAAIHALRVLKANGIRRVFGNPGTTELPLLDGFVSEDMEFVLGLSEGVCTSMADGHARATGQVGVAMVHTSVGTANTAMNLINAEADRSPLLVIAGDKDDRLYGRGHFCEVPDIGGLLRQVTKRAWRVPTAEKLPELMFRGLQAAKMGPSGPVFLSIPENLLAREVPREVAIYERGIVMPTAGMEDSIARELVDALVAAERPLLIAGNGIGAAGVRDALGEVATELVVPIVTEAGTTNTRLNCPGEHPYYHGAFSPTLDVVARADVIVSIGAHLFREYDFPASPWLPPQARVIQIDADPLELNKIYPVSRAIVADAGAAVLAISAVGRRGQKVKRADLEERRRSWAARRGEAVGKGAFRDPPHVPAGRMLLGDLIDGLHAALPVDGVLVDESVMSKVLLQRRFRFQPHQDYFGTSSGGLGWGIGASLGIQMGMPGRRVATLIGDGGVLFAIQGLWSAAKYRLPVVYVVINNGGYMAVRRGLGQIDGAAHRKGSYPGTWIDEPEVDLPAVARGFGLAALRCGEADSIADVLREAFALERPILVDVRVSSEEFF